MRFVTDVPPAILVDTAELVERAVRHAHGSTMLGVDTETLGKTKNEETGLKHHNMNDQIIVMGLAPDEGSRYVVPRKYLHHFKEVLADEDLPKALHNWKFDQHRFANAGLACRGKIADGWVLDFLIDEDVRENRHDLKSVGWDYFNIPMQEYKELFGGVDPREIVPGHPLFEKYIDYASLDPWVSRKFALKASDMLQDVKLWDDSDWSLKDHYWDVEEPQLKCLWEMERRGIKIDLVHLDGVSDKLSEEMNEIAFKLNALVGSPINPGSTKQVEALLIGKMGLPIRKKTKGGAASLDEESLLYYANQMQVPEAQLIVDFRAAQKMRGTYAQGLTKRVWVDGRVHTTYNPVKVTGRLSSSDPNLQNLPQPSWDTYGIRAGFVPDDDGCVLIAADYSQLEMRVLACASGDPKMIEAIQGGLDMHTFAASQALGISYAEASARKDAKDGDFIAMRTGVKAVGFGIVYGAQAPTIANTLAKELKRAVSKQEAQAFIDKYLSIFPGIGAYMDNYIAMAHRKGFVQTISGRFRHLSKVHSTKFMDRTSAERQAINAPIQGSAADIVKKAMIACELDEYLKSLGCSLRLQVHDELVFNCPKSTAAEAASIIQWFMEHPFIEDLPVPLTVSPLIVATWRDAK